MPERLRQQNEIVKWVGIAIMFVSAFYTYSERGPTKALLFTAFYLMMSISAIIMVVALVKIRRCFLDQGLGQQLRHRRMVIHALSFLAYMVTYVVIVIAQFIDSNSIEYYFGLFLDTTTGFISYVCLFFVIWHLGSKRDDESATPSRSSTIEETASEHGELIDS